MDVKIRSSSNAPALPSRPLKLQIPDLPQTLETDRSPESSKLISRAQSLSAFTTQASTKLSTYIDGRTANYVSNTPLTSSPVVVSPRTRDGIDNVAKGTEVVARASGRFLSLIGKKVERLGESALKGSSMSAGEPC